MNLWLVSSLAWEHVCAGSCNSDDIMLIIVETSMRWVVCVHVLVVDISGVKLSLVLRISSSVCIGGYYTAQWNLSNLGTLGTITGMVFWFYLGPQQVSWIWGVLISEVQISKVPQSHPNTCTLLNACTQNQELVKLLKWERNLNLWVYLINSCRE